MLWLIVPIAVLIFWLGRRSAKDSFYSRGFDKGWYSCAESMRKATKREERR